jgi:putative hydrolase of the HAD superfamily
MVRLPKREIPEIQTTPKHQGPIEVIFFDLGNVILPFNHFPIAEKLSRYSQHKEFRVPQKTFSYLFDLQNGVINPFDRGEIAPEPFFHSLKESMKLSISFDTFMPIWNEIFTEDLEVSEIIRSLQRRWRLGLLSNTDPLHFNYILSAFPIVRILDKWILSYEVGFKKPDLPIFQKAIAWAAVEPEKILFIDDTQGHVDAAATLGIQGIHFTSGRQLKEELQLRLKIG